MATDCATAKGLPAATFPKTACIQAANDPTSALSPVIGGEVRRGLPATGPADPKPNIPRMGEARMGAKLAPTNALAVTHITLRRPVAEQSAWEDAVQVSGYGTHSVDE